VDRGLVGRIVNLDAQSFKARAEAMEQLSRLGKHVEEQMRTMLEEKRTLEMRWHIEALLGRMKYDVVL